MSKPDNTPPPSGSPPLAAKAHHRTGAMTDLQKQMADVRVIMRHLEGEETGVPAAKAALKRLKEACIEHHKHDWTYVAALRQTDQVYDRLRHIIRTAERAQEDMRQILAPFVDMPMPEGGPDGRVDSTPPPQKEKP